MYLHGGGSLVHERAWMGAAIPLGAASGPLAKRLSVTRGQRGGLVFTIQRMLLQQLGAPLREAGLLTPRMQDEAAGAGRSREPLAAWVALDLVLRLSTKSMRCAADLEWPARHGSP